MFLLGFILGFTTCYIWPRIYTAHKTLGSVTGTPDWHLTLQFLWNAALVYFEQRWQRSLVFDAHTKTFVLSFVLKGKLHQIWVAPKRGPTNIALDPFTRGYAAICYPNK